MELSEFVSQITNMYSLEIWLNGPTVIVIWDCNQRPTWNSKWKEKKKQEKHYELCLWAWDAEDEINKWK